MIKKSLIEKFLQPKFTKIIGFCQSCNSKCFALVFLNRCQKSYLHFCILHHRCHVVNWQIGYSRLLRLPTTKTLTSTLIKSEHCLYHCWAGVSPSPSLSFLVMFMKIMRCSFAPNMCIIGWGSGIIGSCHLIRILVVP